MNYEIIPLDEFSGTKATVYSILPEGSKSTLFDDFVANNHTAFKSEIEDIVNTLEIIGYKKGAQENLFKLYEGKLADGVVALYDEPDRNLRLYAIRYGATILIVGSGGFKSKNIKALQEDPILKKEQKILTTISKQITKRIVEKEIWFSTDEKELLGNLIFSDNDTE